MAEVHRKRVLYRALAAAVALACLFQLALMPWLNFRREMLGSRAQSLQALNDARNLLDREQQLRILLSKMGPSISADAADTEKRVLHLLHDWDQETQLAGGSFQRTSLEDQHGFVRLRFHITTSGPLQAVASLLYRLETSPMPLRIDELNLRGQAHGQQILLDLDLSTPCQAGIGPSEPTPPAVADIATGGGG